MKEKLTHFLPGMRVPETVFNALVQIADEDERSVASARRLIYKKEIDRWNKKKKKKPASTG